MNPGSLNTRLKELRALHIVDHSEGGRKRRMTGRRKTLPFRNQPGPAQQTQRPTPFKGWRSGCADGIAKTTELQAKRPLELASPWRRNRDWKQTTKVFYQPLVSGQA